MNQETAVESTEKEQTTEKGRSFSDWYFDNKERLSIKRKEMYQKNDEYRKANNERSARWRKEHPAPSRAGESRFKKIGEDTVEVFRITAVSQMIGRSDQTIRGWESEGVIPKPLIDSKHRYYTKKQIMLMRELAELIDLVRYEGRELLKTAIQTKSVDIHKQWADKE